VSVGVTCAARTRSSFMHSAASDIRTSWPACEMFRHPPDHEPDADVVG
jgi:hypothetical protein